MIKSFNDSLGRTLDGFIVLLKNLKSQTKATADDIARQLASHMRTSHSIPSQLLERSLAELRSLHSRAHVGIPTTATHINTGSVNTPEKSAHEKKLDAFIDELRVDSRKQVVTALTPPSNRFHTPASRDVTQEFHDNRFAREQERVEREMANGELVAVAEDTTMAREEELARREHDHDELIATVRVPDLAD